MLKYVKGDLFEADVDALVNTVNTKGVMGGGIALAFKERYPEMFEEYKLYCDVNQMKVGTNMIYYRNWDHNFEEGEPWLIVNFPTKDDYKDPSEMEYVEKGLDDLIELIDEYNIKSIALPALGCGLGGLEWENVKPVIEQKLQDVDCEILVYEPKENEP